MATKSIAGFLDQVFGRLEILRESERRFSRELAPRFNLLKLFQIKEFTLSRCLAHLLDPNEAHGQGDLFLKSFCKLLGIEGEQGKLETAVVSLEHLTRTGRRIDIFIELEGIAIGIENKPWAGYQDRQLEDYADHLIGIARGRKWMLVCLDNNELSEETLLEEKRQKYEENKQFAHLTYDDVVSWLASTAPFCRALKVRIFAEELTAFIRREVNGALDMTQEREVEAMISENESNLEAALAVSKSLPAVKRRLLERLLEQLHVELKEVGLKMDEKEETGFLNQTAEYGFNIFPQADGVFTLRFTFERSGLDYFYWGITTFKGKIEPEHQAAASEIHKIMENSKITENSVHGGRNNKWWAWWKHADTSPFSSELRDWSSSTKPWMEIKERTLAKTIAKLAREVYDEFNGKEYLLAGQTADIA